MKKVIRDRQLTKRRARPINYERGTIKEMHDRLKETLKRLGEPPLVRRRKRVNNS